MKKISILAGGVFALAALSACDYLDLEPLDTIGTDQFYETANAVSLEQYCNNFYPELITGYGACHSYDMSMLSSDYAADDIQHQFRLAYRAFQCQRHAVDVDEYPCLQRLPEQLYAFA